MDMQDQPMDFFPCHMDDKPIEDMTDEEVKAYLEARGITEESMARSSLKVLRAVNGRLRAELAAAQARIAELERELAERPAPLVWTSEPPKVAGLYLRRAPGWTEFHRVSEVAIKASPWGSGFGWFGPIPEPAEPIPESPARRG